MTSGSRANLILAAKRGTAAAFEELIRPEYRSAFTTITMMGSSPGNR
jgi:hypothetical protein